MSRGKQETARRSELIDQLKILSEVASTETALFHQEAAAALGLGITDMKTLSILLQEGPMTAGQISRRLSLTTGAVTNLIDRLEGRGLVERQRDQKDRRKVIVSVNEGNLQAGESPYVSIGKGFQGTIKRHRFSRGPETHGSHNVRKPGSVGASAYPSRVFKGMRMAGQMGARNVTQRGLTVVGRDPDLNLLLVRGAVPGPKNGFLVIREDS